MATGADPHRRGPLPIPERRKRWSSRFADGFFRVVLTGLKIAAGIFLISAMAGAIWIMVTALRAWV
ncbi:hypothetical protein SAMN05444161_9226 [Rhizobiales bacterium GAS191]|nr:hypothetical protein SAMN05444161_9226 [Rhizobiales bacterium GAS191]